MFVPTAAIAASVVTAEITGLRQNYSMILFGFLVTFAWGYVWCGFVRDDEGQPLPSSFAARLFFSLSLACVYGALILLGFLAPDIVKEVKFFGLSDVPEELQKQVPLLGIILMGAASSIPQIKDLARHYAIILHSAQYRHDDEVVLAHHLQTCEFVPSEEEVLHNIEYVGQFDVYLLDTDTSAISLESVGAWRKVSTLLRILSTECSASQSCLSAIDREAVARLEDAHRRKTQLAMTIVRMLNQIGLSTNAQQGLTQIAARLSGVAHSDRATVNQSEEVVQELAKQFELAGDDASTRQAPIHLTTQQLNASLAQIDRYLLTEYKILLAETARLSAKAIVRSGDGAADRLELMRRSGFEGLGRVERVSLDSVIWVLLASWAAAFGGFTALTAALGRMMPTPLIISIATTISIAALIGALWGSRRTLAERIEIPWSSYVAAGLLAIGGFVFVQITRFMLTKEQLLAGMAKFGGDPTVKDWTLLQFLRNVIPFSLGAFFLVIGICLLARIQTYAWSRTRPVVERLTDGVIVGAIYVLGNVAASLLHIGMGTNFGRRMLTRINELGFVDVFVTSPFRFVGFGIGLVIGFIVIRDVRRIAHARIVSTKAPAGARPSDVRQARQTRLPIEAERRTGNEGDTGTVTGQTQAAT